MIYLFRSFIGPMKLLRQSNILNNFIRKPGWKAMITGRRYIKPIGFTYRFIQIGICSIYNECYRTRLFGIKKPHPTFVLSADPWLYVLAWCGAWLAWCSAALGRQGEALLLEVLLLVCCWAVTCRLSIAPQLKKRNVQMVYAGYGNAFGKIPSKGGA